jgi:hypothetical protein
MVKYSNNKLGIDEYDAILIPTGEERNGPNAFPVSREARALFSSGRFGCIFITGGYGGFAQIKGLNSEAEETADYLNIKGIPSNKIYTDNQSLDTLGNFTFPIVQPEKGNPNLRDFGKMMVVGKEGHIWRIIEYANIVLPGYFEDKRIAFHDIEGNHNDGFLTRRYHKWFMKALDAELEKDKSRAPVEVAHNFLLKEHPFYSEGWFDKTPSRRKLEMALTGLNWSLR